MKGYQEMPPELSEGSYPHEYSRRLRDVAVLNGKGMQFVGQGPQLNMDWQAIQKTIPTLSIWLFCSGIPAKKLSPFPSGLALECSLQRELIRRLTLSLETTVFRAFKGCDVRFTPTSSVRGKFYNPSKIPQHLMPNPVTIPHLQDLNRYLRTTLRAVPYETGYLSLAATQAIRGVKDDHRFESWRQYLEPGMIFYPGEVGQVGDIRLIEVTHSGLLGSHQGGRSGFGEMLVFGQDPIMMLEERAPKLHISSGGHRKARKSLDWKGLLAFLEVVSSLKGQGRIIYVTG